MPIDLERIPERLISAIKNGTLVPFIGADVSLHATCNGAAKPLPNWTQLLLDLLKTGEIQGACTSEELKEIRSLVEKGKYFMAAEALQSSKDRADYVKSSIHRRAMDRGLKPGPIHRRLFDLRPSLIVTTNYDRLLEDAYKEVFHQQPIIHSQQDASKVERFLKNHQTWTDQPIILKIRGGDTAAALFTRDDYRNVRYKTPGYRTVLSAIFVTKVVLILGFSDAEPEMAVLTESLRESLDQRSSPDFMMLPKGNKGSAEKRRLRDDLGLHVIEYEPTGNHGELLELVDYLANQVPESARLAAHTSG